MTSNFMRLFKYAKAVDSDPLENYTTEALAVCIEHDSSPIIDILCAAGLISLPNADVETLHVHSQVHVAGTGILDMVLDAQFANQVSTFWVEIKVNAGLSGNQLERYLKHISGMDVSVRPQLVLLCRDRIETIPGMRWITGQRAISEDVGLSPMELHWISWQDIRRIVGNSDIIDGPWHHFRLFLEEIRMADGFDDDILESEVTAMADAGKLMHKMARLLLPFVRFAQPSTPTEKWPQTEADVRAMLFQQFWAHGRFTLYSKGGSVHIVIGAMTCEGELGLWFIVETDPKNVSMRHQVIQRANQGGLSQDWRRWSSTWFVLSTFLPFAESTSPDEASRWLRERLADLDRSGVLALIPKLGKGVMALESDDTGTIV